MSRRRFSEEELLKALKGVKLDTEDTLTKRLRVKAEHYAKDNLVDPTEYDIVFILNCMMIGAGESMLLEIEREQNRNEELSKRG